MYKYLCQTFKKIIVNNNWKKDMLIYYLVQFGLKINYYDIEKDESDATGNTFTVTDKNAGRYSVKIVLSVKESTLWKVIKRINLLKYCYRKTSTDNWKKEKIQLLKKEEHYTKRVPISPHVTNKKNDINFVKEIIILGNQEIDPWEIENSIFIFLQEVVETLAGNGITDEGIINESEIIWYTTRGDQATKNRDSEIHACIEILSYQLIFLLSFTWEYIINFNKLVENPKEKNHETIKKPILWKVKRKTKKINNKELHQIIKQLLQTKINAELDKLPKFRNINSMNVDD